MMMTAAARSEVEGDHGHAPSADPSLVREIAHSAEPPDRSEADDLKGQIIGGRFEVRGTLMNDELGLLLSAFDRSVQRMVSLRLVRSSAVAREVSTQLSAVSALSHPNLLPMVGVLRSGRSSEADSTDQASALIVQGSLAGRHAADYAAERRRAGRPLSLRETLAIVADVSRALTAAHPSGPHGMVGPEAVWIESGRRVYLTDLVLARALFASRARGEGPVISKTLLAPEIRDGGAPQHASDVFGMAALYYELFTGERACDAATLPSERFQEPLDVELRRALSPDPARRHSSPDVLVAAVLEAIRSGEREARQYRSQRLPIPAASTHVQAEQSVATLPVLLATASAPLLKLADTHVPTPVPQNDVERPSVEESPNVEPTPAPSTSSDAAAALENVPAPSESAIAPDQRDEGVAREVAQVDAATLLDSAQFDLVTPDEVVSCEVATVQEFAQVPESFRETVQMDVPGSPRIDTLREQLSVTQRDLLLLLAGSLAVIFMAYATPQQKRLVLAHQELASFQESFDRNALEQSVRHQASTQAQMPFHLEIATRGSRGAAKSIQTVQVRPLAVVQLTTLAEVAAARSSVSVSNVDTEALASSLSFRLHDARWQSAPSLTRVELFRAQVTADDLAHERYVAELLERSLDSRSELRLARRKALTAAAVTKARGKVSPKLQFGSKLQPRIQRPSPALRQVRLARREKLLASQEAQQRYQQEAARAERTYQPDTGSHTGNIAVARVTFSDADSERVFEVPVPLHTNHLTVSMPRPARFPATHEAGLWNALKNRDAKTAISQVESLRAWYVRPLSAFGVRLPGASVLQFLPCILLGLLGMVWLNLKRIDAQKDLSVPSPARRPWPPRLLELLALVILPLVAIAATGTTLALLGRSILGTILVGMACLALSIPSLVKLRTLHAKLPSPRLYFRR